MDPFISPNSPELSKTEIQTLAPYAKALGHAKRRRHSGIQAANLLNRKKGHGLDLLEVRPYQASDEIRHMDWRITARTGAPHTKVYTEEIEHKNFVVLSMSADAYFGTQTTFISTRMTQLAALICWRSQFKRETTGSAIFAGDVNLVIPQIKDWQQLSANLARATRLCQRQSPIRDFNLAMLPRSRGHSVMIISDHQVLPDHAVTKLSSLAQHNRVYWITIDDPGVFTLPDGYYAFANQQKAQAQLVSDGTRQQAQLAMQTQQEHLAEQLTALGIAKFSFDVNESPITMARELLALGVIH